MFQPFSVILILRNFALLTIPQTDPMLLNNEDKTGRRKNRRKKIFLTLLFLLVLSPLVWLNTRQIERKASYLYLNLFNHGKKPEPVKPFQGRFGVRLPGNYSVHGIDVSIYQKKIDWRKVAAVRSGKDSIVFAFIKATEGRTRIDPCFDYNWKNTAKSNIIRGAYHFYVSFSDPVKQARNFIEVVELRKGDLPPVLDIERTGSRSSGQIINGIKVWLKMVEQEYGMKPIIYTNYSFYIRHLKGNGYFTTYPVWIAHYISDEVPRGTSWLFWQHTEKAIVPGIVKKVDMNVFKGTRQELKQMTKK